MFAKMRFVVPVVCLLCVSLSASASVIYVGGTGAFSTDGVYGSQGLLSGGETATATFAFSLADDVLTLTVTNTSPAVLGTDALVIPDAPVISDMFFHAPSAITGMQFLTAAGGAAAGSGWDFTYDPDMTPSSGFGFLKKIFDVGLDGGPDPGSPDPVIASVNDPNIFDGPGDPMASPVAFTFKLTFLNNQMPVGFSANWFADGTILSDPPYLAAAKFMSGANGGSATVTSGDPGGGNIIPAPASLVLLVTGIFTTALGRFRNSSKK